MSTFECVCHWCGKNVIRKSQGVPVKYHYCDIKCKSEFQRSQKPVTREWLVEHYINQGLDTTKIGHIVSRDPKSVWNWLKDFEIPTRKRGFAAPVKFVKGQVSTFKGKRHTEEFKKRMSDRCKAEGRMPFKKENGPPWKGKGGPGHPSWKGGMTPERQAFYQTPDWKKVRREVWARDQKTCRHCGVRHEKGMDFDIHHIVAFACRELRAEITNLVLLCEKCHYWIHGKENTEGKFVIEWPSLTK